MLQYPRLQHFIAIKQNASLETLEKEINIEKTRLNILKKTPSFGYDNLIANWVYLNFLQYFGDEEGRAKTGYSLSPEYFEVILKRDPRFLQAYLGLSISTSMYSAMPERSIGLMEEGLKSLSPKVPHRAYYVWRYKGIDELLFLGNAQASEQSFTEAASWASKYTDEESKRIAYFSYKTADFLHKKPNSKYAQISTWVMVLNNQVDEKARKRVIREIEALGGEIIKNDDGTIRIKLPEKD
ncbi:hypothetical protein PCC6912_37650 [Chlorogloeopsis fritschii PCC 6912]|uniref:Uncharacterized protein n=1 Tax=Chlorogloeopsis fritschii PCC 6912 TaxID=211165 RepID=A0A433N899_CHLFR|nr:hypothetical protein PCC6912_37650 [Chlorogloeopsis fritschii PCC 6912]